jgi:LPS O-antigen subunit length determinant protein (WzzB/FepE family)
MSSIIDGQKWLETRLAHLEAQLAGEDHLSDEERTAIEAETVELKAELAASRRRFRRFLLWGGRTTPM